ncbi:MAG: methyl-accepting chemotaxis protein [Pseudomonadota bacterium]
MKVWHKILVGPTVAIVFLIIFKITAFSTLSQQHATLTDMFTMRLGNYQVVAESANAIADVHSNVYRLLTWLGNLKQDKIVQIAKEQSTAIDSVMKKIAGFEARSGLAPEEQKIARSILTKLTKYKSSVDTAIDLSTIDINTGMSAMQTADDVFRGLSTDFKALVEVEKKIAQISYNDASARFSKVGIILLVIFVMALLISIAISFFMSSMIVKPLNAAISSAGRIAAGDLNTEIFVPNRRDETGLLMQALRDMSGSLKRIVGEVRTGSDAIAISSNDLAAGNLDLSSRTEQQANSLGKTAVSMHELTATVKQNVDNAKRANQLAASASEVAVEGGKVVVRVVNTMDSINASARKIVDIIAVIDGIAFQTNILALNAAVEAARAGEQGRGFAVVATEVRGLAHRSALAAKEIKMLIGDSVEKVGIGSKLASEAGITMDDIVASVKSVTGIMSEIVAASQEQSDGIERVNEAITQMDQVTQQNAVLVGEAGSAAESLQNQAIHLSNQVAFFRLDAGTAETARH